MLEDGIVEQRALQPDGVEGVHERPEAGVHLPGVGIVRGLLPAHERHEGYVDEMAPEVLERCAHRAVVDDDCGRGRTGTLLLIVAGDGAKPSVPRSGTIGFAVGRLPTMIWMSI